MGQMLKLIYPLLRDLQLVRGGEGFGLRFMGAKAPFLGAGFRVKEVS